MSRAARASTCRSTGADPINPVRATPAAAAPPASTARRPERPLAWLLAAGIVLWIVTARSMGGMDAGPGTPLGALATFLASWVLMMAAMMLPAELRFTLAYARFAGDEAGTPVRGKVAGFLVGYLLVWTVYGLLAWLLDALLRAHAPAAFAWQVHGPQWAGAVVIGAGLFQFSRWKQACLMHCISPFGFFMRHWYAGMRGALRLGATHGLYCVGCCWALMATMFAVGVMSLYWMMLLAVAMFIEKMAPARLRIAPLLGVTLVLLGLWIALDPASVPGLTAPSADRHHLH